MSDSRTMLIPSDFRIVEIKMGVFVIERSRLIEDYKWDYIIVRWGKFTELVWEPWGITEINFMVSSRRYFHSVEAAEDYILRRLHEESFIGPKIVKTYGN